MTKIEIEIAKTLNGSTLYMAAVLVDSYGDKLLVPMSPDSIIHAEQYFTPCNCCGVPVLDSSISTDGHGVCDHCTVTPVKSTSQGNMETRIKEATELADTAFWKTVAELFPEAKTGDFSPAVSYDPEPLVRHWVDMNVPKIAEPWTEELGLHYFLSWSLLNTGGGVMAAVTKPVQPDNWYIGVSSEYVIVYQMNSDGWLEEGTDIAIWTFGDNPTKLMALLDRFFSSTYDSNQLFDDIITIGKSNRV